MIGKRVCCLRYDGARAVSGTASFRVLAVLLCVHILKLSVFIALRWYQLLQGAQDSVRDCLR